MKKPVIIISGKNSQVGKELQQLAPSHKDLVFFFFNRDELNIADESSVKKIFEQYAPSIFINTAAYTAVDKAETEQVAAYTINAEAVGTLARYCRQFQTKLVHISTDYVFDGKGSIPYKEDDPANPVNYYGYTKWMGEHLALNNNPDTIIIRTSWVYSAYGNNFVKTMLRILRERKEIGVVNDQFGSPTYGRDLAEAIFSIVHSDLSQVKTQTSNIKHQTSNIFHFSNEGVISWYDFALAIKEIKQLDCVVSSIATSSYPTPAKRPAYSVLDKTKICGAFNIRLRNWKDSLQECLKLLD